MSDKISSARVVVRKGRFPFRDRHREDLFGLSDAGHFALSHFDRRENAMLITLFRVKNGQSVVY